MHAIVAAPGYRPVTTHIFDAANEYLDSDAVFGVRGSLIQEFTARRPAGSAGRRVPSSMSTSRWRGRG